MYSHQQQSAVVRESAVVSQQQQQQQQQQQPLIMAQQPYANVIAIRNLSVVQILFGVVAIILGVVLLTQRLDGYWPRDLGGGIWSGVIFIVSGCIGAVLAKKPFTTCFLGTVMFCNIFATLVSLVSGVISLTGLLSMISCDNNNYYPYENYYGRYYNGYDDCGRNVSRTQTSTALFGVLIFIMVTEFFLALVIAIYCCSGCCRNPSRAGMIIQRPYQNPPQYVIANSQHGQYPVSATPASAPSYPGGYNEQPAYTTNNMEAYGTTDLSYTKVSETKQLIDERSENPPPYTPRYNPNY